MALRHVQQTYEELGRKDPMYAVLSRREHDERRWSPEEFFATGTEEINAVLDYTRRLELPLRLGRALDFGCGLGRLTQALADHFESAVGVDIAESMVEGANEFNRHADRVRYLVNTTDDLAVLKSSEFDFVYSNITLQHIPPEAARNYISEFFRLLGPGGVAIFNVPDGPSFRAGSPGAWYYSLRRGPLRRVWKRMRGRPAVEIHYIPEGQVRALIEDSGGRLVDIVGTYSARSRWGDLRYCAVKGEA
jgi:SAM-dependent methyltransferase